MDEEVERVVAAVAESDGGRRLVDVAPWDLRVHYLRSIARAAIRSMQEQGWTPPPR